MPSKQAAEWPAPQTARPGEEALGALSRTLAVCQRVMQPYLARFGISGTQWSVLRALSRADEQGLPGLRLSALGERLLIRPASVRGIVDRLERAGFVARDSAHTDVRARRIRLTPPGRRLVERVLRADGDEVETALDGLTPTEQADLQRLLGRLELHLEQLLQAGPAGEE
jgi:DNA-binding MarR family transcriptional regulator